MASIDDLPNELIRMIVEWLFHPGRPNLWLRHDRSCGSSKRKTGTISTRAPRWLDGITSPIALAVLSPTLLAEYARLVHQKANFWFQHGGHLYDYINQPDVSESTLSIRRSLRSICLKEWHTQKEQEREDPAFRCVYCNEGRCKFLHSVFPFFACASNHKTLTDSMLLLPKVVKIFIVHVRGHDPGADINHPRSSQLASSLFLSIERANDLPKTIDVGYLGRNYPHGRSSMTLSEVASSNFMDLVFDEIKAVQELP
ncbi:uncharacterized protein BKA78DRAFT_297057 [Phyllosticta capitalensis]|uniref:uncharacterized protein n=1 Tax=Phyllosticta capitalensis TaxID=121624 RepID=UPI00312E33A5